MSWQSLIKPPGKDPKNINEWLALITEKIRELKQTENWYDVSRVITTSSIVDSLDSHRSDAILSANQGRTLKELIDEIETKIVELSKNSHIDIAKLKELLDENIPKIASNIQSIADLTNRLNELSNDVTGNSRDIESINTSLTEITSKISKLESSLNVLSDRINKNNDAITKRVEGLETKVDQNLVKVNNEIAGITSDIGQLVGGNEILSGLSVTISNENVITTTEGKVIIKGDVISIDTRLSINVTDELLNRDCILMLTLKINSQKQPILVLVENISADEVLISKLSIIDGKIVNNSKMEVLQPINTMVGLAAENEADTIRETIPSGFTKLGELDYDYMLNHENEVKIKSESVAYVNGYKVVIPKDTVINIGKAPEKESREDLLFLEAWKDEDFLKTGKVKWRIRHEINVDFDSNYDGLSWSSWYYKSLTFAQGGNPSPVCKSTDHHIFGNEHAHFKNSKGINEIETSIINFMLTNFNDAGLFVAGDGTEYYRNLLKTIDGFSYAIPMFRLYRKPSCGKSIPFEYSKINPKVDYSKFAKLMKEEKVERVVSENIQGLSLINLATPYRTAFAGRGTGTSITNIVNGHRFQITTGVCYAKYTLGQTLIKPLTTYTIYYNIKLSSIGKLGFCIAYGDSYLNKNPASVLYNTEISSGTEGKISHTFTTKNPTEISNEIAIGFTMLTNNSWCEISNLMILEGDWSNKKAPEFFTGLKSLGEDDGNLITIKNGILDDDTYDVNDGNQKLTTFSEVSHVLSKNSIIPNVEADIKKGKNKISSLTTLGTKIGELDGTEIVEFTKIKGRTIHNLYGGILHKDNNYTEKDNSIWLGIPSGKGQPHLIVKCCPFLKPDTTYSLIFNILSYTSGAIHFCFMSDTTIASNEISVSESGLFIKKFTTLSDVNANRLRIIPRSQMDNMWEISKNILILEGDYTSTPLDEIPFIEGIKSVGDDEDNKLLLSTVGKNLFNIDNVTCPNADITYLDNGIEYYIKAWGDEYYPKCIFYLKPNTKYSVTISKSQYADVSFYNYLKVNLLRFGVGAGDGFTGSFTTPKSGKVEFRMACQNIGVNYKSKVYDIQLEEDEICTEFESYKEYKQEIHLKEPLRSLSNEIYDEVVGNKVIRRVGKYVYDGSESWGNAGSVLPKTLRFGNSMLSDLIKPNSRLLCNRFISSTDGDQYIQDIEGISCNAVSVTYIRIARSELNGVNIEDFKTWLSQNPVTVYYELKTPVEEYLENVYDKESIKTYQLDAPLRSLPNGIKDEIKDGVLIRRCGEITYNEDNYFTVISNNRTRTIVFNIDKLNDMNPSHVLCVDKFPSKYVWEVDEEGMWIDNNGKVYISILKSKLTTSQDSQGLKSYLKSNNIKVIYPLIVNNETILTEVNPQSSNFSLQRQFTTEGNWLRELPNGIKDTIENGKVKRRVGKIVLNGSESSWTINGATSKFGEYILTNVPKGPRSFSILSDKLFVVDMGANINKNPIGISATTHGAIRVRPIDKDDLAVSDVKAWLERNPLTVLYELETPTDKEELSIDNYMNYPYHSFNTYCGNIYVGDGRNYVLNENKLPSENNLIINTEFREIDSAERLEDCNYKKSVEGYDTQYLTSSSKNLIDISSNNILNNNLIGFNYQELDNGFIVSNTIATSYSSIRFRVHLKAGVTYKIIYESSGPYATADLKTMTLGYICHLDNGTIFKVNDTGYHSVNFYCTSANSTTASATFRNIRIIEGGDIVPFVLYNKTIKYFENMDENDVDDLRHQVSLTGFNYSEILEKSFDSLLRGEL